MHGPPQTDVRSIIRSRPGNPQVSGRPDSVFLGVVSLLTSFFLKAKHEDPVHKRQRSKVKLTWRAFNSPLRQLRYRLTRCWQGDHRTPSGLMIFMRPIPASPQTRQHLPGSFDSCDRFCTTSIFCFGFAPSRSNHRRRVRLMLAPCSQYTDCLDFSLAVSLLPSCRTTCIQLLPGLDEGEARALLSTCGTPPSGKDDTAYVVRCCAWFTWTTFPLSGILGLQIKPTRLPRPVNEQAKVL